VQVEGFGDSRRVVAWPQAVENPVAAPRLSDTRQVVVAACKVGWEASMKAAGGRTWASLPVASPDKASGRRKMAQETYNRLEVVNQEAA